MRITPTLLLYPWLGGFAASLVIQGALPAWFAGITAWGRNVGWQAEIAIWNLGISIVLIGLLRRPANVHAAAVPGLAVMSFVLGLNHLIAGLGDSRAWGHWLGAVTNFSAVILASLYFVQAQRAGGTV